MGGNWRSYTAGIGWERRRWGLGEKGCKGLVTGGAMGGVGKKGCKLGGKGEQLGEKEVETGREGSRMRREGGGNWQIREKEQR